MYMSNTSTPDPQAKPTAADLQQKVIAIFADENNPTTTPGAAGGVLPGVETPPPSTGVTGKPEVATPVKTESPITLPSAPTEHPDAGNLEAKAKETLKTSLAQLMKPDANIGMDFNNAWFKRLNSTAVPHTGIGKDFVRKTGVNDVGHKDTLRYSRLVDALNNRRYIGPAKGGASQVIHGHGVVSVGNSAIGPGDIYKMDGLETAESRAQKRAEGYEALERGREIGRREDVKDMPAALERLKQLAVLDQAGKLTDAQRAEQQQLFAAMLNNQYNIPYIMMQQRYNKELDMTQQQYNTMLAMQMAQYAAMNGLTTQQYAAQLGMDQARYNTMLGMVTQQFGTTLAEYIYRVTGIQIPMDKVNLVMSNPDYMMRAMSGAGLGVGAPDLQAQLFAQALRDAGIYDIRTASLDQLLGVLQKIQSQLGEAGIATADAASETNKEKEKKK
jgi:hypothetical protein